MGALADPRPRPRLVDRSVNADVFLLTDTEPTVLAADAGVDVARSEPASTSLLDDLRSDTHMGWVPESMWFTYYDVSTPAGELRHDLAVSTRPDTLPSARMAGFSVDASPGSDDWWVPVLLVVAPLVLVAGGGLIARRRVVVMRRRACAPARRGGDHRRCCWRWAIGAVLLSSAGASGVHRATACSDPARSRCASTSTTATSAWPRRSACVRTPRCEFVVVNHDPIGHELIVGGPDVQARHANGHEAYHPPVSGEVSVPADGRASTTYVFHAPGPVEYACHLPRPLPVRHARHRRGGGRRIGNAERVCQTPRPWNCNPSAPSPSSPTPTASSCSAPRRRASGSSRS